MTVYVLWFDDGNRQKYIVGIFNSRDRAHSEREGYPEYERYCMSVEEYDVSY